LTSLAFTWIRSRSLAWRAGTLVLVCAAVIATVFLLPPIHVPTHMMGQRGLADTRTLLGIPNALDVLSNLPFALAGFLGLTRMRRLDPALAPIGAVLFAALIAVALGSSYYHLAPSPGRLLFDRLPITLAFMSIFALVLGDRLSPRVGRAALAPLVALAAGTALYWYFGGTTPGGGDLRPYSLTQALPMVALPVLICLFPGRLDERRLLIALLLYAAAKVCELFDAQIFALSGVVSGHSLKHLAAGAACFCLVPADERES